MKLFELDFAGPKSRSEGWGGETTPMGGGKPKREGWGGLNAVAAIALASLSLAGCAATPDGTTPSVTSTIGADIKIVAAKIDSGVQLTLADLPTACEIAAGVGTLAQAWGSAGISKGGAAQTVKDTAAGASAVANSGYCANPNTTNVIAASAQIIGAVVAVKQATQSEVTATVVAGVQAPSPALTAAAASAGVTLAPAQ